MSEKAFYPELLYYRTKVLKISVEEVIKDSGMSKQTYLRAENGKRELTLSEASAIVKNMNMSWNILFPKFFSQDCCHIATNDI